MPTRVTPIIERSRDCGWRHVFANKSYSRHPRRTAKCFTKRSLLYAYRPYGEDFIGMNNRVEILMSVKSNDTWSREDMRTYFANNCTISWFVRCTEKQRGLIESRPAWSRKINTFVYSKRNISDILLGFTLRILTFLLDYLRLDK